MNHITYSYLLLLSSLTVCTTLLGMELSTLKKTPKVKLDLVLRFHSLDKDQLCEHADNFKKILTESNCVIQNILNENNQCSTSFSQKNISQLNDLIKYQHDTSEEINKNPFKILHDLPEYSKLTLSALNQWRSFIEQGKVHEKWFEKLKAISDNFIVLETRLSEEHVSNSYQIQAAL